jgi:sugar lactone lactonase
MLATVDDGSQLLAAEDGLYLRDRRTGALNLHTALEADNAVTRSNDGRVHPSGALWIGTMGKRAERKAGAIYWFREGEVRLIFPEIGIPNAISFSPDGRLAYFADTQIDTVYRTELEPETGIPIGSPSIFLKPGHDAGSPDGAIVDADGVLWCARWGGSRISAYAPDGSRLAAIPLPVSQPTCPAFVGRDCDRMIVTSATQDLERAALDVEPDAGKTFLLDLPVKGRPEPPVRI